MEYESFNKKSQRKLWSQNARTLVRSVSQLINDKTAK